MRKLIIILVLVTSRVLCFSQNQYPPFNPEALFSELNTTFATTGFLIDKAEEPVHLSDFDGTELTDSNYVNTISLNCLYKSIQDSELGDNLTWNDLFQYPVDFPGQSNVVFDIALYRYNKLSEDAILNGIIAYSNGHFTTVQTSVSPFEEKYLFAAATPKSLITSLSFNIYFHLLPESNVAYQSIEFDADDGMGYRAIPTSGGINVTYGSAGYKEIKLRVAISGNQYLLAHSVICVQTQEPNLVPANISLSKYTVDTLYSEVYNGVNVSAYVQISYADSISNQLKKPFIVVEGFDPIDLRGLLMYFSDDIEIDSKYGFNYLDQVEDYIRYIDSSYDIVYVNWNNSEADIRANALLLQNIILTINSMKSSVPGHEPNVLMGQSMGGLIARYALVSMEQNGINHDVSTFISHDAPHLGVSIPISALYAIRTIEEMLEVPASIAGMDSMIEEAWNSLFGPLQKYLNGMSAKQMLYNYVDVTGGLNSSVHNSFLGEMNLMGFPKGTPSLPINNLAIVNGSDTHMADSLTVHGNNYAHICLSASYVNKHTITRALVQLIMPLFYDSSRVWDLIFMPSMSKLQFDAFLSADNGLSSNLFKYNISYEKRIMGLSYGATLFERSKNTSGAIPNLENAAGSVFWLVDISEFDETNMDWIEPYVDCIDYIRQIMFVPSESALASYHPDYSRNAYYSHLNPISDTPFLGYYVGQDAMPHIVINNDICIWLRDQLAAPSISGNAIGESGDVYNISSPPSYLLGGTWSTSNSDIATIDSSGELTVIRSGVVDIIYTNFYNGACYGVKKTITTSADSEITSIHFFLREEVCDGNIFVRAHPLTELDSLNWLGILADENLRGDGSYYWRKMVDSGFLTTYSSGDFDDFIYDPDELFPEISIMPLLRDARYEIYMGLIIVDNAVNKTSGTSIIMRVDDLNNLLWPRSIIVNPDNIFWVDDDSIYDAMSESPLIVQSPQAGCRMEIRDELGNLITTINNTNGGFNLLSNDDLLDYLASGLPEMTTHHLRCVILNDRNETLDSHIIPILYKNISVRNR